MRIATMLVAMTVLWASGCGLLADRSGSEDASSSNEAPRVELKTLSSRFLPAINNFYADESARPSGIGHVGIAAQTAKCLVTQERGAGTDLVGLIRVRGTLDVASIGHCDGTYYFHFAYHDEQWVPRRGSFTGYGVPGVVQEDLFVIPPEVMQKAMPRAGSP